MSKATKNTGWVEWSQNSDYPEKRGVCEFCGHRDEVKQAFDRVRYICANAHACFLRWTKERDEQRAA